jgi:hypothetical protein
MQFHIMLQLGYDTVLNDSKMLRLATFISLYYVNIKRNIEISSNLVQT